MNLVTWATKWGISTEAVKDLMQEMGVHPTTHLPKTDAATEAGVQQQERLSVAREGGLMWRNNVGAMTDVNGRTVRYGLANESTAMNRQVKSSDLIGVRPLLINGEMVGHTVGQFVARECKKPGWTYAGTSREQAQRRFLELVISKGGDARFTSGS